MLKLIKGIGFEPVVKIDANVFREMQSLVSECNSEIGWMALSKRLDDNIYYVYELVPVKQEVSSVTTDLMEDGLQEIFEDFQAAGRIEELNNLRFWGHSHVNMDTTPSITDEDTFDEYIKSCQDYFIRFILNKKGNYSLDLADCDVGIIYTDLKYTIVYSGEEAELYRNLIKKRNETTTIENELKARNVDSLKEKKSWAKNVINKYLVKKSYVSYAVNNDYVTPAVMPSKLNKPLNIEINADDKAINDVLSLYYGGEYEIRVGNEYKSIGEVLNFETIEDISISYTHQVKSKFEVLEIFKDYEWNDWLSLVNKAELYMDDYFELEKEEII